jgi:hypothetical protein
VNNFSSQTVALHHYQNQFNILFCDVSALLITICNRSSPCIYSLPSLLESYLAAPDEVALRWFFHCFPNSCARLNACSCCGQKRLKTMVLPPDRRVFHQFPCGERTMAKGACCTTRHSDYYLSRWYAMMACSSRPSNFFAGLIYFTRITLEPCRNWKAKKTFFTRHLLCVDARDCKSM